MKKLTAFAASIDCRIMPVNFRFRNTKQRGYALLDPTNREVLTFEPCHYSNGDRWFITGPYLRSKIHDIPTVAYAKNISHAIKILSNDTARN